MAEEAAAAVAPRALVLGRGGGGGGTTTLDGYGEGGRLHFLAERQLAKKEGCVFEVLALRVLLLLTVLHTNHAWIAARHLWVRG